MPEPVLMLLKFCLVAVLYLFFFRVLRAVWGELNPPRAVERAPAGDGGFNAPAAAAPPNLSKRQAKRVPTQLTVLEPADQRGRIYPLASEMTMGRAGGCQVAIPDDTFASQIHARVFSRDGQFFVEDLGSTNGTFLNSSKVGGPQVLKRGDKLKVGGTLMELA